MTHLDTRKMNELKSKMFRGKMSHLDHRDLARLRALAKKDNQSVGLTAGVQSSLRGTDKTYGDRCMEVSR